MDDEHDVLGGYLPAFVQHLEDARARLGLRTVDDDSDTLGDDDGFARWTPGERDAFFRAVSVHSRWRPDLIAACVPTRSEWEVWMYLEALEEGAAALAAPMERGDKDGDVDSEGGDGRLKGAAAMDVDGSSPSTSSDSRSCSDPGSDADEDEKRDDHVDGEEGICEPAYEVSQDWIDVEERMAAWIIRREHLASVEDVAGDTVIAVDPPPKRKRGRPRGTGKAHTQSRVRGRSASNDEKGSLAPPPSSESTSTAMRKRRRDDSVSPTRKREALMSRLEIPHLLVLDNILREGEEAIKDRSKSREGSVAGAVVMEPGDERVQSAHDPEATSLPDQTRWTENAPGSSSDAVIDPVLLALSGGTDPASGPSQNPLAAHVPIQDPCLSQRTSPESAFQPGTSNVYTLHAALIHSNAGANVELDLSLFSPRSRRRIQKRLYMRRKRAQLRENGAAREGIVDTGVERLKPGKKAKLERRETPVASMPTPRWSEAPSDAEMELTENAVKKNKGGLTLPYKLKAQFAESGVDAAYLRNQGMDLLNLSVLGRLMGIYSSLEDDEEESVSMSIDGQLIRHLQATMVLFVTDVIHRAIVWREREIRLKRRSQVWRQGDQITLGVIEHVVEVIGTRYRSHKEYFESLAPHGFPSSEPPGNASDDADPDVEANVTAESPGLSRHRDVYTPLVRPPSAWGMGPLACLARTYEREAMRTRCRPSAGTGEEELMADETDAEALEAELQEEDEAEALDMALSAREERALWGTIR